MKSGDQRTLIKDEILAEARQQVAPLAGSALQQAAQVTPQTAGACSHVKSCKLKQQNEPQAALIGAPCAQSSNDAESLKENDGRCTRAAGPARPAEAALNADGSATSEASSDRCVTIIHFNDCYNVEPGTESSGAAGFLTAVNQYRQLEPLILFSGDIISPSFMSTFTKGEQMIPVLNDIGVHCAVFGNHEFDFGVDNLIEFTRRTNFPWLLSNVVDKETSRQLGDGQVLHVAERGGLRIGLMGLIEEEWLSTLSTLDSDDVIYVDFVERGRELARQLRAPPHCADYVIALTHFRTPNDCRLADAVPEIDLILGGHDHDYEIIQRPNCHIVKSGTDFREFSLIKLRVEPRELDAAGARVVGEPSVERIICRNFAPDKQLQCKLDKFVSSIDEKMGQVLGQFNCDLDGRFSSIRKYETNLGNFVTDIMLASTHADVAILNSGTLRSDRVHPRGEFTMRDLFNILGYIDPIAVLEASGWHIWRALENGVSQWPKLEGRFPQVSGCSFAFDPSKPPGQRIEPSSMTIGDEPLQLDRLYRLTTKAYLASGKDGYDMLKECKTLVPGDESPDLTTSILNHFEAINIVKSNRRTHHRQSIICLSRTSLKKLLDSQQNVKFDGNNNDQSGERAHEASLLESADEEAHEHASDMIGTSARLATVDAVRANSTASAHVPSTATVCSRTKRVMSLYEIEHEQCRLEPKVEGRIRIIGAHR